MFGFKASTNGDCRFRVYTVASPYQNRSLEHCMGNMHKSGALGLAKKNKQILSTNSGNPSHAFDVPYSRTRLVTTSKVVGGDRKVWYFAKFNFIF